MALMSAITLAGNSAILTTNATPSTSNSVPVVYKGAANLNLGDVISPQLRLLNIGTAMIWLNFSSPAAGTAIIPTPGTTTLGTPQPVIWLAPNVEIVLSLAAIVQALTPAGTGIGFWLNTISTGVSQSFQLQFGDGL
jgi:hypothetical protein